MRTRVNRLRVDRVLTLGVSPYLLRQRSQVHVPILMYHALKDRAEGGKPFFALNTSPAIFEQHLRILRQEGYVGVNLSEALASLHSLQLDQKIVAITFDDGLCDFYTHAFPLLLKYGFKSTLFVVSDFVGRRVEKWNSAEFMNWRQLREVSLNGVEVGSHTVSHPQLHQMSWTSIEAELRLSKEAIEDRLGQPVSSFAYPFAFPEVDNDFVTRLAALLHSCGYQNGVCTVIGTAHRGSHRYYLPRLPINSYDDPSLFSAKLAGYYNWLHTPQYIYKSLKYFYKSVGVGRPRD